MMKSLASAVMLGALACGVSHVALAAEGPVPTGVPKLNHVFVIMMENHNANEVLGNPNNPFVNSYAESVNLATNYYAVAHPSLTNYLEITGGSNFGVLNDASPDWFDTTCQPNIASGVVDNEALGANVCPIQGTGTDAATPAIDYSNETSGPPGDYEIDGIQSIPAATNIVGMTIADQLVAAGKTWKNYQENLPLQGPTLVNNSDGEYSNLTDFSTITPQIGLSAGDVVALYAVKHDPFAYFTSTQTFPNTAGFEALYADLASGKGVPSYSFIVPNQCHDQHGKGGAGPFCAGDPNDDDTMAGLNPGLMQLGDIAVQKIVTAIHDSPIWKSGKNAIVLVWDENDYYPGYSNQVVMTVDTNYAQTRHVSNKFYTHFSLLKSVEAGLGLPCLNHACDSNTAVMSDLFAR